MRTIDSDLIKGISPSDDESLSKLGGGVESFVVVNPELDMSVLDYINLHIEPTSNCFKFKVGNGWIAKAFPAEWSGSTRIIQLQPKIYDLKVNYYVETTATTYVPDAWDLKYIHIWNYEGTDIEAVSAKYMPSAEEKKLIGTVKFINHENIFDVIFISNNEPEAESNWERLKHKWPGAKRVNGVKGILNAHKAAAELATTEMFWVVDADAYIVDNFAFTSIPYDREAVHIWHSRNPVNGLEYGYGGVKLFPRELLLNNNNTLVDVSTSLGKTRIIKQIACETRFNTDPFNTWKSAFRECAKLASRTIKNQISSDTQHRLEVWCNSPDPYAAAGAKAGKEFGEEHKTQLVKINDYEWLYEQFNLIK